MSEAAYLDPRLVAALKRGDVEAVRALVAEGVDVSAPTPDACNAMFFALETGVGLEGHTRVLAALDEGWQQFDAARLAMVTAQVVRPLISAVLGQPVGNAPDKGTIKHHPPCASEQAPYRRGNRRARRG